MAHAAQNRLAKEASAYLRQHANNPVDWFPWCEEALAKARREDKPILLSIGYSACHWCHVMERESFEDEAVAALLNAGFVSIKVDREERPDLDQIYQSVVQLLGRGGGWPLTVFLTPDQRPFFAGTYFPPVAKYGMPSFSDLLVSVRKAYDEQREDVALQAAEIAGALGRVSEVSRGKGEGWTPGPDLLAKATKKLFARFDDEHGGFGSRPKFPNTMNVEVLLRRAVSERDTDAEARVRRALDGMRQGGIWDHLGGGFHRYSTDEKWLVPHFEKMLYDNALLGRLYVDAGRALEASGYVGVARDIAAYLVRDMQSAAGALYATEDADSEGVEGKYFVWTPAEVDAAVADPLAREVVKAVFGITEQGNFEESHTNATVLSEALDTGRIAVRMGKPPSEIEAALAAAKTAMLAARGQRIRPFRDEKRLACWNGLAIGALAEIGGATGDAELVAAAERAFEDVEINLVRKGRVERYFDGEGFVAKPGFLDDHANLANAALDLYEVTGKPRYVTMARDIADDVLARFAEPDGPGFYFTPSDGEPLLVRMKDPYDQAVPAGAAMTALLLLRLGTLVGGAYAERAARYLESVAASAVENPFGLGQTVSTLDRLIRGSIDVVVVGGRDRPETAALVRAVLSRYVPNRTLAVVDPGNPATLAAASALADGKPAGKDGTPVAYVCRDRACSPPVSDPAALIALLAP